MSITDGYSPLPEQSTLAMVVHHPQAIYYGMRNGRLLENGSPDEVIRGTTRDATLIRTELLESDDVPEGGSSKASRVPRWWRLPPGPRSLAWCIARLAAR